MKAKLLTGVVALASRTVLLQAIAFGATFILTILLPPDAFGVFFLVSAVISFLSYFSDIGFAAALVQRPAEPDRKDLATAFTVQQVLVSVLVVGVLIAAPAISAFYGFGADGLLLLRALAISFFLSSLKTIPSIILERKLQFSTLVYPQILETVVFYATAIILATSGYGIGSFAWAAILRGISGTVLMYILCPWPIRLGISRDALRHLLSFGLPFQLNSLLALVKDDLVMIVLGKILPIASIGYIGWAKKWAEAPLRLIMDNIIRVTFPAFSRLQEDKLLLGRAIEKSLFFLGYCMFPATILILIVVPALVDSIPKYEKWEPALIPFYFYCFSAVFAAFSSPMVNALNAIGKIKTTLVLMLGWTVLTWILVPASALWFGYTGVAAAAAVISLTGFIPILLVKRHIPFTVLGAIYRPFVAALASTPVAILLILFTHGQWPVTFSAGSVIVIYLVISWLWMRREILPYLPGLGKLQRGIILQDAINNYLAGLLRFSNTRKSKKE